MKNKPKIFSDLERLAPLIPAPVAWADLNGMVLGVNDATLKSIGAGMVRERIVGKTPYEYYPKDIADSIVKNVRLVMQRKKTIMHEEVIEDITTGKTRYFLTTRAPLFDDDGLKVVGIIETAVEITDRKENEVHKAKLQEQLKFKKIVDQTAHDTQSPLAILLILVQYCTGLTREKVFETLKAYTAFIPISVCWLDVNNAFVGMNKRALDDLEEGSADNFIGKTLYDLYPYEMSDHLAQHNSKVMQTGKVLTQEGAIRVITTGEMKHYNIFKSPLYDNNNKVIGVLGVSVDITSEKNVERLRHENELQRAKIEEQEKARKIADQVVHDIRSPLASLLMILKSCEEGIPEKVRIALREAATGIGDIANNLLCQYEKDNPKASATEERQHIMVSLTLLQLLSEKRHQYKKLPIKFTHDFCQGCNFVFIKAKFDHFKRMMSNLINNAVDALDEKEGKVGVPRQLSLPVGDNYGCRSVSTVASPKI